MLLPRRIFNNASWLTMLVGLIIFSLSAVAHTDGGIEIKDPWVSEAPPNAKVLAAYMQIENHTAAERSLRSVSSTAFEKIEIHQTIEKDGMARMEKIDHLKIPAQAKVTLEPGGLHMMLIHPNRALKAGDNISLTLKFSDNSKTIISVPVKKGMASGHNHTHMDHDHMETDHDRMQMKEDHMQHDDMHNHDAGHMSEHHHDM